MATDYVHLHKKALSSWVFNDPRRWHFFSYLMMKADEKGYAEVSVNEYCKTYGQERTFIQRLLKTMEEMGICEPITLQKRTIVFLCKYESYNGLETESAPIMRQKCADNDDSEPSQKEKEEKKGPPCTPFKEKKEKKDTVGTEVASLQQQQQPPVAEKNLFSEPIEKRRERFWADCCHCHALHPDWPAEGVKNFFLFWTQADKDGLFLRFEMEKSFGMSYRMKFFLKRGQWLDEVQEAKLDRIKGKKAVSREEESYQRRRAAALAEDDAGREERDRQRDERAKKAATVEEIKAILGDRWVGEN